MTLPTWDLSDLYKGVDDPQIEKDLHALLERAEIFKQKFKGSIARADLTAEHLGTVTIWLFAPWYQYYRVRLGNQL